LRKKTVYEMGWNRLHQVCMEGKTNDIEEEIMKKG
jgi:hypothetical protein